MFLTKLFRKLKPLPHWRCLTCKHFCLWEGDYYCLNRNKILIDYSPSGRITREQYDILCKQYKHCWFYSEKLNSRNKDGLYIPLDKLIRK